MSEAEMVQKCKDGNIQAYRRVYDLYGQSLMRMAVRMLGQVQDAEDAVQTTFIRLHQGIAKFRHDAKLSTYLFRILVNVCFDQLEKKKKMRMQTLESVNPSHDPKTEVRIQLEEAIGALPHQQKACFILFAIEELPQKEIAGIMGLSLGGVKSNIHHAKMRLRSMLTDF